MPANYSNKIRAYAEEHYVSPARKHGRRKFSIRVRDVWATLIEQEGLPRQNVPQVCQALRSPRKFLEPLGLEIEKIDGPPSQLGTTVVYHYRFRNAGKNQQSATSDSRPDVSDTNPEDSPLESLRGLLREELAAYGGGEAFIRWLRTDPPRDRR